MADNIGYTKFRIESNIDFILNHSKNSFESPFEQLLKKKARYYKRVKKELSEEEDESKADKLSYRLMTINEELEILLDYHQANIYIKSFLISKIKKWISGYFKMDLQFFNYHKRKSKEIKQLREDKKNLYNQFLGASEDAKFMSYLHHEYIINHSTKITNNETSISSTRHE